jgi:hypothetical protein
MYAQLKRPSLVAKNDARREPVTLQLERSFRDDLMNITVQRMASLLILTLLALMLLGCGSMSPATPEFSPASGMIESPNPAYAAQATMDYGQSQLMDLSRKATEVSLSMSQATNAAAQATQDYYQLQKMDLDYQATVVSLNIAHAAATQKFIAQQTKIAVDATAIAQSRAATSAQSAYLVNITQTAQAQAILDAQVVQTAQAAASLTAYPKTATPFAVTQAALLMQQYDREQQSFVDKVVAPLIPIVAILDLILFILLIVLAYRWHIPMPWSRRLPIARVKVTPNPLTLIDGEIADHNLRLYQITPSELTPVIPPRLPSENTVFVEIIDATEPPVAHWIAEVEQQLVSEGRDEALSANRYLPAAQNVAYAIPGILAELGLDPLISRFVLTETERGEAWLFVVMDDSILEFLESYAATSVLSHLSAALHGHLVMFSNSLGLRYAVLLGSPNLLRRIE